MSTDSPFHIPGSLEYGWDVLSKRWVALVTWSIILSMPHVVMNLTMFGFKVLAADHLVPQALTYLNVVVNLVTFLLYTKAVLLCMDDESAGIGEVLSGFKFLIPFSIASFLFFLAISVGTMLLVIPGIFLGLALGLYSFLVIDQFMGPIEALKRSWEITKGHRLKLLFLYFVLSMVVFGGIICFGIGVIPASIVSTVALADVYRKLDAAYDNFDEEPVPTRRTSRGSAKDEESDELV